MGRIKNVMPQKYFDLREEYLEGWMTEEEFDKLCKQILREAFEKILNG